MSAVAPLDVLRQCAAALLALADLHEQQQRDPQPTWFDSRSYPFGPKAFRRHIHGGLKAIRVGKRYRVASLDAQAFWVTLERKPAPKPQAVDGTPERWQRAGLRAVGGAR